MSLRTTFFLPMAGLLVASCTRTVTTEDTTSLIGPSCLPVSQAAIELDDLGPRGHSGRDLLEAFGADAQIPVDWTHAPGTTTPATDEFTLELGEARAGIWSNDATCSTASGDLLVVEVPASLTNADRSLQLDMELRLYSADLDVLGVAVVGEGAVVASGAYQTALQLDNPSGEMHASVSSVAWSTLALGQVPGADDHISVLSVGKTFQDTASYGTMSVYSAPLAD